MPCRGGSIRALLLEAAINKPSRRAVDFLVAGIKARDGGDARIAEAHFRRALSADPNLARAHNNLGELLLGLGKGEEAETHLRRATELQPGDPRAWNNLAAHLSRSRSRQEEAKQAYEGAIAADPAHVPSLYNYGQLLSATGDMEGAKSLWHRALGANPQHLKTLVALHHLAKKECDWADYDRFQDAILACVRGGDAPSFTPFSLLSMQSTPADQLQAARRYAATLAVSGDARHTHRRTGNGRRIRVGYLSRDYFNHATAALLVEVLEKHDHGEFEVVGYDYSPDDGSPMRKRILRAFDQVAHIRKLSDKAAADQIHSDEVDILVDLKGYTKGTRSKILAYRPAPIQVNFLGYPGTMGAEFADYILGDATVTPKDHAPYYSERIVRLPHCYQPNDRNREVAATPTRREVGLPEGQFVFCCFNNTYKISPAMFDIWMRLLRAMPYAVLWLFEGKTNVTAALRREATIRGVDADRLLFAPSKPMPEHIARYALADLFLDTLPYNAHTTASEAIWAGLPVITCLGNTFASRVCASILHAAGVPELVTTSLQEYERRALELARARSELAAIRAKIRNNRDTMPLFDSTGFTLGLEDAYRQMWERWRSGESPIAIEVDARAERRLQQAAR